MTRKHPNTIAATSTGAGAALVLWLLQAAGIEVGDPAVGAVIASLAIGLVLLVGRRGLTGIARLLWRGDPNL